MIANQLIALMPIMMVLGFFVAAPIIFYASYKALYSIGLVGNAKTDNGHSRSW